MISEGIQPANFLNDLLEIIYFIQQKKRIGNFNSDLSISESEQKTIESISNDISIPTLIVYWQLILKVLDELSIISNPILSLEMLVFRLVYLKDMPSYESVLDLVNKNEQNDTTTSNKLISEQNIIEKKKLYDEKEINRVSKDQIKNTTQTKPILSLAAAIAIAGGLIGTGNAQQGIGAAGMGIIAEKPEKFGQVLFFFVIPETLWIIGFVLGIILLLDIL